MDNIGHNAAIISRNSCETQSLARGTAYMDPTCHSVHWLRIWIEYLDDIRLECVSRITVGLTFPGHHSSSHRRLSHCALFSRGRFESVQRRLASRSYGGCVREGAYVA